MKQAAVPLVDQAREFAVDELFFSATDRRGVIRSGNQVFVRISGHSEDKLVGSAHNIIRHPDMPRAAFRLVWQRLVADQSVAALVKNLAADGRYYWVVALITPAPDGFLSVRFKPTGAFLAAIAPIYAEMLAAEREAEAQKRDPQQAMDAGAAALTAALTRLKFANYEEFMRVMLCHELKARDATLAREGKTIIRVMPVDRDHHDPIVGRLVDLYRAGGMAYSHLNRLYNRLDEFVALSETLENNSAFVDNLTVDLRISSMNVALASSRLGGEGDALQIIAGHMEKSGDDIAGAARGLVTGIDAASQHLQGVIFNLSAARLQMEMVLAFTHELVCDHARATKWEVRRPLIRELQRAFSATMREASNALQKLEETAQPLSAISNHLERQILSLRVSQIGGVVEGTQLSSNQGILEIFAAIREQIDRTHQETLGLTDALLRLGRLANESPFVARAVRTGASAMDREIERLSPLAVAEESASPVERKNIAAALGRKAAPELAAGR